MLELFETMLQLCVALKIASLRIVPHNLILTSRETRPLMTVRAAYICVALPPEVGYHSDQLCIFKKDRFVSFLAYL